MEEKGGTRHKWTKGYLLGKLSGREEEVEKL